MPPREANEARGTVESMYRGAYTEAIERDDPFNSPDDVLILPLPLR
jgi:hypothetical protein